MRRVLAVVAAAAMVAGSLAIRSRLDRDEEERAQELRLVCASELEDICRSVQEQLGDEATLSLTFEPAGTTADRLASARSGSDTGLDGWLVTAPWPEIVDARRQSRALPEVFAPLDPPVARSPLVIVASKERGGRLAAQCRDRRVRWECLGAFAGDAWPEAGGEDVWGRVKPGFVDPVANDTGALVLGQAVADYFGRSDDLSLIDLDSDDAFTGWFDGLARSVRRRALSPSPLSEMLTRGFAQYDAVGTTEAEAGPLVLRAARQQEVDVLYPSPVATADVVLAQLADDAEGRRLAELWRTDESKDVLAEAGWRVEDRRPISGVRNDPLPSTSNLPAPGLLDALRSRWAQAAR